MKTIQEEAILLKASKLSVAQPSVVDGIELGIDKTCTGFVSKSDSMCLVDV